MKTVTIEIIDDKVIKLLQNLEFLQLIRLKKDKSQSISIKLTKKYKGSISKQSSVDIEAQLAELRNGWE